MNGKVKLEFEEAELEMLDILIRADVDEATQLYFDQLVTLYFSALRCGESQALMRHDMMRIQKNGDDTGRMDSYLCIIDDSLCKITQRLASGVLYLHDRIAEANGGFDDGK